MNPESRHYGNWLRETAEARGGGGGGGGGGQTKRIDRELETDVNWRKAESRGNGWVSGREKKEEIFQRNAQRERDENEAQEEKCRGHGLE